MKRQTIGRLFSLLLCATLTFTSVDFSILAVDNSEDTTIVSEDIVETVDVETENNVIADNDDVDTDIDGIDIEDDENINNDYATTYGITNSTESYMSNFTKYDGYELVQLKYSYTSGAGTADQKTNYVYGVKDTSNPSIGNFRDLLLETQCFKIGDGVFSGSTSYLPEYVTGDTSKNYEHKKNVAAKNALFLRSVTTNHDALMEIGNNSFNSCSELRFVNLGSCSRLTTIGNGAFANCSKLDAIILPSGVTSISSTAFSSNTKLVCVDKSVTLNTLVKAGYSNIYIISGTLTTTPSAYTGETPTISGISKKMFSLTLQKEGKGVITPGISSSYAPNSTVAVSFSADTGYTTTSVLLDGTAKSISSFSLVMQADHSLKVVFTPNKYTITLDPNGASVLSSFTDKVSVTYDSNVPALPTLTRTGYDFIGWNTKKDGSGTYYSSSIKYTVADNITLYAQWKSDNNEYEVKLDANGGTCDTTSIKVIPQQKYPALPTPTRKGYTFLGWFKDSITQVKENDTVMDIVDSLYAHWEANTYTITLEPKDGKLPEGTESTLNIKYDSEVPELPTPTKEGDEFLGWNTKFNGSGSYYSKGLKYTEDTDMTLYAQWKVDNGVEPTPNPDDPVGVNDIKVTLDPNGGYVGTIEIVVKAGQKYMNLPEATNTRAAFVGWFTEKVGGTQVTLDTVVITNTNHTLYAHWTDITLTVKQKYNVSGMFTGVGLVKKYKVESVDGGKGKVSKKGVLTCSKPGTIKIIPCVKSGKQWVPVTGVEPVIIKIVKPVVKKNVIVSVNSVVTPKLLIDNLPTNSNTIKLVLPKKTKIATYDYDTNTVKFVAAGKIKITVSVTNNQGYVTKYKCKVKVLP